ncbi:MAG: hypothetical protein J6C15_07550 [Bacteroidaceae bacterium]|nr:hypothetical protein [Bacteroidaceae bacterium]
MGLGAKRTLTFLSDIGVLCVWFSNAKISKFLIASKIFSIIHGLNGTEAERSGEFCFEYLCKLYESLGLVFLRKFNANGNAGGAKFFCCGAENFFGNYYGDFGNYKISFGNYKFFLVNAEGNLFFAEKMPLNGYKKAGNPEGLPLRCYKDNTLSAEIQMRADGSFCIEKV